MSLRKRTVEEKVDSHIATHEPIRIAIYRDTIVIEGSMLQPKIYADTARDKIMTNGLMNVIAKLNGYKDVEETETPEEDHMNAPETAMDQLSRIAVILGFDPDGFETWKQVSKAVRDEIKKKVKLIIETSSDAKEPR